MQHTTKYQLNLIERNDPFSPDALNENTQKVEQALLTHEGAVAGETSALDARVKVLEAQKFVSGTYVGNGVGNHTIELGFTPRVVFLNQSGYFYNHTAMLTDEYPLIDGDRHTVAQIVPGGFLVSSTAEQAFNQSNHTIFFFAVL